MFNSRWSQIRTVASNLMVETLLQHVIGTEKKIRVHLSAFCLLPLMHGPSPALGPLIRDTFRFPNPSKGLAYCLPTHMKYEACLFLSAGAMTRGWWPARHAIPKRMETSESDEKPAGLMDWCSIHASTPASEHNNCVS